MDSLDDNFWSTILITIHIISETLVENTSDIYFLFIPYILNHPSRAVRLHFFMRIDYVLKNLNCPMIMCIIMWNVT